MHSRKSFSSSWKLRSNRSLSADEEPMKKSLISFLIAAISIAVLGLSVSAQQPARSTVQQPQAGTAPALANAAPAKQPTVKPPARSPAQTANAKYVEATYIGMFQTQVGLSDDQIIQASVTLQTYIRNQLMLADNKANVLNVLEQLLKKGASTDEMQAELDLLTTMENRLVNTERTFFKDIDPQLTILQRAKLRVFLKQTNQLIHDKIHESESTR